MAATPDTSTLTSSEQIFTSHTLPQIRAIHKSLHVQIDEKSARLRTQVGNSYRELLGTADTIVDMKREMQDVQEILGRMGGLCGRAVIGSKIKSAGAFRARQDAEGGLSQVARCRLLEACGLTVGRLIKGKTGATGTAAFAADGGSKKGDRLVVAAKVLVLGRLLVSSFGSSADGDAAATAAAAASPPSADVQDSLEAAKKTLSTLRRRLLKNIDKLLEKVGDASYRGEILKAMCAYSLASSSGAKDVMWHFLNVRAKALSFEFNQEENRTHDGSKTVLKGLDIYTGTLLDVQALIPSKLSEALASMKRSSLLADESLQALESLRLDIYERWCGDVIHHFTPFIQHNDLEGSQARDMLRTWSEKGAQNLLSGMRDTLAHSLEFKTIVDLRTSVLEHWIKNGGKAKGFDPSEVLDGLRKVINDRLLAVLDIKVSKLRLVGSEVSATLEAWKTGQTDRRPGLWDDDLLGIDASENANQLTHEVISRLHGRSEAVSRAVTSYQSWYQLVDDVGELVELLKRQRWDNDVEEIEDEEVIDARQKLLSKEDPQRLHDQLNTALQASFDHLDEHLSSQWRAHREGDNSGDIAMYLLRILRDIRGRLPKLDSLDTFGVNNIPELHEKLAARVSISPLEDFATTTLTRRRVVGLSLWEGEPALPTHPSPGLFKLIRGLVTAMGDAGLDLWTPAAVQVLKKTFCAELAEVWRQELESYASEKDKSSLEKSSAKEEGDEPKETNGDVAAKDDDADKDDDTAKGDDTAKNEDATNEADAEPTEEASSDTASQGNEVLVQWVYDLSLLQECLRTDTPADGSTLETLVGEISDKAQLSGNERNRMVKASQEYWKRTNLLFGLLA